MAPAHRRHETAEERVAGQSCGEQASRFGGWTLYLKDGKTYTYNFLGLQRFTIAAQTPVPVWKASIRYEFAYDRGGVGKGGVDAIFVNGKKVAEGRIELTQPIIFSADEGADIGENGDTVVGVRTMEFGRHGNSPTRSSTAP
jgi:hypothetical protein